MGATNSTSLSKPAEPFPSDYEAPLILREVKNDDRVVYLESCTCLPLVHDILEKVTGSGELRVAGRNHEDLPIQDGWATLVVGECVLDEFRDSSKAISEFLRILAPRGKLLLSGPVRLASEKVPKVDSKRLGAIETMTLDGVKEQLRENGFGQVEVEDMSAHVLKALERTSRYKKLARSMISKSGTLVFIFVKAIKR